MNNLYPNTIQAVKGPRFLKVSKDSINSLHFPKSDVLYSMQDKIQRDLDLTHAIKLGNIYHGKVTISFEDIEGLKQVETTVWGITDCQVILKKNVTIPISRIVSINY